MQKSIKHHILFVEIPGCATTSFAASIRAGRIEGIAPFAIPSKARKVIGDEEWREMEKIATVRPPVERFVSAVALMQSITEPLPDHFAWLAVPAEEPLSEAVARIAVLMLNRDEKAALPINFRPQSAWLTSKLDVVLAVADIPAFLNSRQFGVAMPRANRRVVKPPKLSPDTIALIERVYAEDVAKFANLPVWTANAKRPRTVYGECKSCAAKKVEAKAPAAASAPVVPDIVEPVAEAPAAGDSSGAQSGD